MNRKISKKILLNLINLLSVFLFSFLARKFKNVSNEYSNEIIIIASFLLMISGKILYLSKDFSFLYLFFHIKNKKKNFYSIKQIFLYKLVYFTSAIIYISYFSNLSALKVGILKQSKIVVLVLVNYLLGIKLLFKEFFGVVLIITGVLLNTFSKNNTNTSSDSLFDVLMIFISVNLNVLNMCRFDKKIKKNINCFIEFAADFAFFYFLIAVIYQIFVYFYKNDINFNGFKQTKVYILGLIGAINVFTSYANYIWFFALDRLIIFTLVNLISDFFIDKYLNNINHLTVFFYCMTMLGVLIYKNVI